MGTRINSSQKDGKMKIKRDVYLNKLIRRISDSFEKMIIVGENRKARRNEDGFVIVGIRQFLLDDHIL